MTESHTISNKNQSGIVEDIEMTREEVRCIKKMAESEMRRREDEDSDVQSYAYPLGGSNWADLDNLRTKCKIWLVENQ